MKLFRKTYNISFYRVKCNSEENNYHYISDVAVLECLKILQKTFKFDIMSTSFSCSTAWRNEITIKCYPDDKMEIVRLFCRGLEGFIAGVKC